MKSCLAADGASPLSRFSAMATLRPLVAALAMCCLYLSCWSMITPSILTCSCGSTACPLMMKGVMSRRSLFLEKWMMAVFSASNVAPLRDSQSRALSMMSWIASRFACADGPTTHAV